MILKLNRGKAMHLIKALEYYGKEIGLTEPMRYLLLDLQELVNSYDNRSNS